MDSNKLNPVLTGVAGEYYVAAELSKRGYIASITLRNTRGVDILCADQESRKAVSIQVKTNKTSNRSWIMNIKHEKIVEKNLFYVFVNLNDNKKPPDYFIVPSKAVAKYISESHRNWLSTPGKRVKQHKDTPARKFEDYKGKYLNRWDLLGLD
ncbi:MAG: aspartate ammonia-lyase [Planctomycetes bacterium]|nr:aspartate ammonia-lyase [Planctomycetota bacterium]